MRSVNSDGDPTGRTKLGPLLDRTHFNESGDLVKAKQQVRELEEEGKELIAENRR